MFKLDLEKAEEPEIKLPTSVGSSKKQESTRRTSTVLLTAPKQSVCITTDCVDHNKLWKILKAMGIPDTWPTSWEIYTQVRKQQLELAMEQQTGSK